MKIQGLLEQLTNTPVFRTDQLIKEGERPRDLRRQLSRWAAAGLLIPLRRGVFVLAPPYRTVSPHPFSVANALKKNSYVSLQTALGHYDMIFHESSSIQSVTTGRPERIDTIFGSFVYRQIKPALFSDFTRLEVMPGQCADLAVPGKALLDYVYLTPGSDVVRLPRELGLKNLELVDQDRLKVLAKTIESEKLKRTAGRIIGMIKNRAARRRVREIYRRRKELGNYGD